MSDPESSSSNVGFGDPQWLCMVTLFIASIVTLLLYLVQYFQSLQIEQKPGQNKAIQEEADALLGWALSLKSWKSQWKGAWCRALNDESRKSGRSLILTFEEDGVQSSELVLGQVSSFRKAAGQKAVRCKVVGDRLQFSLDVASPSTSLAGPCRYSVKMAPLELQLELQMRDAAEGEIQLAWGVSPLDTWELQFTPSFLQDNARGPSVAEVKHSVSRLLCEVRPSMTLSCRPAQATEVKEARDKAASPPKPPRAHDWKLLVKNTRVALPQEDGAAGSMNPLCVLQLDDPPQRFCTSVLKDTTTPAWEQPFIFELNGRSKELIIEVLNDGRPQEGSLVGQVSVPFDLVKKNPNGLQTFALVTKDQVTGSLTTEFTYLEPSEVRTWLPPTPAPTKKVEMDRTVMPCGTVVTTITAVKSKPGRLPPCGLSLEPSAKPPVPNSKLLERRVSEQPTMRGATVSKALSSSDTELLMLNGTDPVAEAAIRQLNQSAKLKLKSPVKKSTIIISGVAKTPISQGDEMTLMAGYAAAMDASMSEGGSLQDVTAAIASGSSSPPELSEPPEGPSGMGRPPDDWESQAGEEPDQTSLSLCVSEPNCKKARGSFLQKGAKLFFRRRHHRKEPGMSQSHNDLVYLEHTATLDRVSRTATLSRMFNRKLLPRSKRKANGSTASGEPHA